MFSFFFVLAILHWCGYSHVEILQLVPSVAVWFMGISILRCVYSWAKLMYVKDDKNTFDVFVSILANLGCFFANTLVFFAVPANVQSIQEISLPLSLSAFFISLVSTSVYAYVQGYANAKNK